jgi:predicted phosphohydrolase
MSVLDRIRRRKAVTLAWATDIHLDHAGPERATVFLEGLRASGADAAVFGGDISVGPQLVEDLEACVALAGMPIHFVLGNHDYWGWSVDGVRRAVARYKGPRLFWLPAAGCVELAKGVGLVGHGGWGDAHEGDFEASDVILNDYIHIQELHEVFAYDEATVDLSGQEQLRARLQELGRNAAATLEPALLEAASRCRQVIVLTHVPPFPEAVRRENHADTAALLPGYCCGAVGELLRRVAADHPDTAFTVLSGHTHGEARATILPNLVVRTGAASYGSPRYRLVRVTASGVEIGEPVAAGEPAAD